MRSCVLEWQSRVVVCSITVLVSEVDLFSSQKRKHIQLTAKPYRGLPNVERSIHDYYAACQILSEEQFPKNKIYQVSKFDAIPEITYLINSESVNVEKIREIQDTLSKQWASTNLSRNEGTQTTWQTIGTRLKVNDPAHWGFWHRESQDSWVTPFPDLAEGFEVWGLP